MATHTGSEGTVKVGTAGSDTVIAEIRSFSIEETADTLETTTTVSYTHLTLPTNREV